MTVTLPIARTWDGAPLPAADRAVVQVGLDGAHVRLRCLAPFAGDPPPAGPPGPTDRLWEHEVVEWFVVGPGDRYLEVELGPHGHHLVLALRGVRTPLRTGLPLHLLTRRCGRGLWSAEARVPRAWLPPGPWTTNAYRIEGTTARRYLAHAPVPGPAPDFHRLDAFPPCPLDPVGRAEDEVEAAAAALGLDPAGPAPADDGFEAWSGALTARVLAASP